MFDSLDDFLIFDMPVPLWMSLLVFSDMKFSFPGIFCVHILTLCLSQVYLSMRSRNLVVLDFDFHRLMTSQVMWLTERSVIRDQFIVIVLCLNSY